MTGHTHGDRARTIGALGAAVALAMLAPSIARADDCIPPTGQPWSELSADGARLTYCYPGAGDRPACKQVDLTTGVWSAATRTLPAPVEPQFGADEPRAARPGDLLVTAKAMKRCDAAGTCETWKRPRALATGIVRAGDFAVDAARRRLVVVGVKRRKLTLTAYDLGTGAKVATRTERAEPETSAGGVAFLDDGVMVRASDCEGPWCAEVRLYDARLKRRGAFGDSREFEASSAHPVPVAPSVWAFHDSNAHAVVLYDAGKGKVMKPIEILPDGTDDFTASMQRRPQGDLLVWASNGVVALVDPATGGKRVMPGPACKQP